MKIQWSSKPSPSGSARKALWPGGMEGQKYNRVVRLHKLVYGALLWLVWKGFLTWMKQNQAGEQSLKSIESFKSEVCQETFEKMSCNHILELLLIYLESPRDDL